jgi:hypothetical protein
MSRPNYFQVMSAEVSGLARWLNWRHAVNDIIANGAFHSMVDGRIIRTREPTRVYEQLLYATQGLASKRQIRGCNRSQRIALRLMGRAKLLTPSLAKIYVAILLKR